MERLSTTLYQAKGNLDLRCCLRRTHRLGIDDEMRIGERQLAIGVHFVPLSELDLSGSRGWNVFLIRLEAGTEGRSLPGALVPNAGDDWHAN
jgi:hypothetical protein